MKSTIEYNAKVASMFGQNGSVFGIAAMQLHEQYRFKILTSDMANAAGLAKFRETYPEDFIDVGIAEQNLIGMAAGLASEGNKVIAVAQACFISMRSFEQVRQYLGYMQEKVVLVGIGSGFSLTYFGNTHYAIEDVALMRTIPGMTVLSPADAGEAMKSLEAALNIDGPVYIRLSGTVNNPIVYQEDYDYDYTQPSLVYGVDDAKTCIIATGTMVYQSILAAKQLEDKGMSVKVIDMHCIKPFHLPTMDADCQTLCVVEEHNIIGGLGSAVAEAMAESQIRCRFVRVGVNDQFSRAGDYTYLLEQNGLTANHIVNNILAE